MIGKTWLSNDKVRLDFYHWQNNEPIFVPKFYYCSLCYCFAILNVVAFVVYDLLLSLLVINTHINKTLNFENNQLIQENGKKFYSNWKIEIELKLKFLGKIEYQKTLKMGRKTEEKNWNRGSWTERGIIGNEIKCNRLAERA